MNEKVENEKAQNQSVKLSPDEIAAIDKIAEDWGVSAHMVRHFAIQRLIADVKRGWKPKTKTKTVKVVKLEP